MINIDLKNNPDGIDIQGNVVEVCAQVEFLLMCLYKKIIGVDKRMTPYAVENYMRAMVEQAIEKVREIGEQDK